MKKINKKILLIVFILSILSVGLFIFNNAQAMIDDENTSNSKQYALGELIVKLKEGKTLEDIKELNARYNVILTEKVFKETADLNLENTCLLTIDPSTDILSMAKDYSDNPNVEYAEPNYIAKTQVLPVKPLIN